jgi:hypothetical protein
VAYFSSDNENIPCSGCGPVRNTVVWYQTTGIKYIDAGETDGDNLKILWFVLDKVAGLIQVMSVAHRQEMLDTYMQDSN